MPIDDDPQDSPVPGSAGPGPEAGRDSAGGSVDGKRSHEQADAPQAETAALTRLLTSLADDPDAPPSSVTAESVLAAARAEQSGRRQPKQEQPGRKGLTAVPGTGRPTTTRRRTGLIALVAAASLAGIAAIVVPLTLGAVNSTDTASNGASDSIVAASGSAAAQSLPVGDQSAAADAGAAGAGSAAAAESAAAPGPAGVSAPDGAAAAQPSVAAGSAGASAAAGGGPPCWPPLSPAAAAALTGALPPGAFAPPVPLDGGCEQDPVAGAVLSGSVPGTELVVRVVKAEPGACARSAGEAGSRCVAAGPERYTATDPSGGLTVYVYGNGTEVAAGSLTSVDGVPSVPTGLSADQLETAARAVLGALP